MAEIPADVFQYSIQSQINNLRHSNKVAKDIIGLLNDADKEILAKLEKWGDSQRFTPARLRALLKEIRQMVSESYAGAHSEMETAMLGFGAHVAEATTGMMATQLPMSWSPFTVSREQLQAIVSDAPIKIGEKGAMLLEEAFNTLAEGKVASIRNAIRLGMVSGEGVPEITRRLKGTRAAQYKDGILEGSRRDMEKIVRSVVQNTSNQAVQATYQANSNILNGWIYCGTLDSKMCSVCSSHYGQQFPLGEGPLPILHISCRCFQLPAIKTWKELGVDVEEMPPSMKASANGPVRADMSYQEWLSSQDKATQIDILGSNRQKLFTEGRMKFDSFVDDKGKFITLDELKKSNSSAFKKAFGS